MISLSGAGYESTTEACTLPERAHLLVGLVPARALAVALLDALHRPQLSLHTRVHHLGEERNVSAQILSRAREERKGAPCIDP